MVDPQTGPPILVYDDDCGFCTWNVERVIARGTFEIVGFSQLDDHPDVRERLPGGFEDCAHLVTRDRIYSCGAAMEAALARAETPVGALARAVGRLPGRKYVREPGYRFVANRRGLFGRLTNRTPPCRGGPRPEDGGTGTEEERAGAGCQ